MCMVWVRLHDLLWHATHRLISGPVYPQGRSMLEANMLFSYGSAEPSVRLLWRYGILELLLPLQVRIPPNLLFEALQKCLLG